MTKLTKKERELMDKFKALHRFRVAKTPEEYNEAVKYAKEYCETYKLNFKKEFHMENN